MTHSRARLCTTGMALVATLALPRFADAQTKVECIAAFDHAQELRNEMKLRAARDEFRSCARDACSPLIRKDCSEQLEAVSRDMPSLVLAARDEGGADIADALVYVDGERVASEAGFPITVDPGQHTLRFERAPWAPATQSLVVRVGERNRLVVVTFSTKASTSSSSGPPAAGVDRPAPSAPRAEAPPSTSPWPFVVGAVGVAALGSFAFFGISGMNERSDLERSCAPDCSEDAWGAVRTRFIVADVSLGIAVVSLAAATVLFLVDRSARPPAAWQPAHFFARNF